MAEKLKKALGLIPLTFYGVGTIVGAGIYAIIGVAAGEAGYNMWIAFVLATIAATFSAYLMQNFLLLFLKLVQNMFF